MKICIIGPSGAGKTTISKKLAHEFNIQPYEFDEIYWDTSGLEFLKNSEEFMAKRIDQIVNDSSWIVEGAYDKRMYPFLTKCFLILKIEVPLWLRAMRLIKRLIISTLTGKQPRETLNNTIELIKFSYSFEKRLNKFISEDTTLSSKTFIVRDVSSGGHIIRKMLFARQ